MHDRFEAFTVLISKLSRSIRRIKTEVMNDYNLKVPHVSCVYYLFKKGDLTAKELCDICEEDKSAISRSIEHLEKEGYVTCPEKVGKRYKSPLSLTEKGRALGNIIQNRINDVLDGANQIFPTEDEREFFYKTLEKIAESLSTVKFGGGDNFQPQKKRRVRHESFSINRFIRKNKRNVL